MKGEGGVTKGEGGVYEGEEGKIEERRKRKERGGRIEWE
jgi:hypothetical protein